MRLERERNPTARAGLHTFALVAPQVVTAIGLAFLANIGFKLGLIGTSGGLDMLRRCLPGLASTALGTAVGLLVFA